MVYFTLLDDLGIRCPVFSLKKEGIDLPIHGTVVLSKTKGVFNSPNRCLVGLLTFCTKISKVLSKGIIWTVASLCAKLWWDTETATVYIRSRAAFLLQRRIWVVEMDHMVHEALSSLSTSTLQEKLPGLRNIPILKTLVVSKIKWRICGDMHNLKDKFQPGVGGARF